jgi:hypothetical protein
MVAITQCHNSTQGCTTNQQVITNPPNVVRQTSRNLPNDTTPPNVKLHPIFHDEQAGNYPGRYILKIMCGQMHGVCFTGYGSIFLLKPHRSRCFRCIYRHGTLIRAMVYDVDSSVSDGSFDPPDSDIYWAHHEKSISQRRGSSSAVMQLFFSN